MKYFCNITILLFCTLFLHIEVRAQQHVTTIVSNNTPVATQSNNGRYEFIQSTITRSQSFLLDKYTGKVWRYKNSSKEFEELEIIGVNPIKEDIVNFQLYFGGDSSNDCFLLNIHTGEMWRYGKDSKERTFIKLKMPWE